MRAVVISVLSGVALAACTAEDRAAGDAAPGELSIGYVASGNFSELRQTLTTEPLVYTGPDGEYRPGLALDWSVSDDGLTVTLTLVSGATFHDGVPLDARAVKELLDEARIDPRQLVSHPPLADIDAVDTAGKNVVRLHYKRGAYLQLDGLALRVEREVDGKPIGTGPFILQSQTRDTMTLVANSAYHQGQSAIDVVHVETYPTTRTAWVAMMRQEVDFLVEVPNRARDFVAAASDVDMFMVNHPYATIIGFNVERKPFTDIRVRRALNHAVNRSAVIDRAFRGVGRPTSGLSAEHWALRDGVRNYTFDPQLADQLLTDAGYNQATESFSRRAESAMSARLRFTCLIAENWEVDETIALLVQRQLFDLGVDMQIEAVDLESLLDRATRQNYEAVLRPQNTTRSLSRLYSLWHSSQPFALPGYTAVDDALDALKEAASREDVRQAAREFQNTLYDDPPALFLVDDPQARALSHRFVTPDEPDRDVVETIWQWRLRDPSE